MRQNQKFVPRTDISLDHERRGTAWDLSIEKREEAANGLEILGYHDDARLLRAMNERLARRSQIAAVPDDPRRPLKSASDRPLLVALDGAGEDVGEAVAPAALAWSRVAAAAAAGASSFGLGLLDAEELARLARASRELAQEHLRRSRLG